MVDNNSDESEILDYLSSVVAVCEFAIDATRRPMSFSPASKQRSAPRRRHLQHIVHEGPSSA